MTSQLGQRRPRGQVHRHPAGSGEAVHHRRQVEQPARRPVALVLAQHPHRMVHRGQCRQAGLLDAAQRGHRLIRFELRHLSLQQDAGQVVTHQVVQVAGELEPLRPPGFPDRPLPAVVQPAQVQPGRRGDDGDQQAEEHQRGQLDGGRRRSRVHRQPQRHRRHAQAGQHAGHRGEPGGRTAHHPHQQHDQRPGLGHRPGRRQVVHRRRREHRQERGRRQRHHRGHHHRRRTGGMPSMGG